MRKREWVVYAKRPFGGPDAVLAYLLSVAPAVLKTTVAALAQPPFPFESDKSDQTPALNLHSLTPPPVRTPPRFPPSRLFGRVPPCIPSRLRLAGIRKPLTKADLTPAAGSFRPGTVIRSSHDEHRLGIELYEVPELLA